MDNQEQFTEKQTKQRKQKRLAIGLQIVSGLMLFTFIMCNFQFNVFKRAIPYLTTDEFWTMIGREGHQEMIPHELLMKLMSGSEWLSILTTVLIAIIFSIFQQICIQIGQDNSFSVENVKNFTRMTWISIATAILYLARLLIYVPRCIGAGYTRVAELLAWGYTLGILVFLMFAYLCRTLARLVKNAANLQEENDLTI